MSAADSLPLPAAPRKRVEFIDLLRGWAVIVMIETHVFNCTLTSGTAAGDAFQVLRFINGLVAPSFLFASGMAYAITTRRKLADYLAIRPPLFRQFGRLLLILALGYMLHLPRFNYSHLAHAAGPRAWELFFQADVLHCIAISLLFMQVILLVVRTERRLYRILTAVSALVVLGTPVVWGIEFHLWLPTAVAAYLNGLHDSLFPLFPWSAFLFAGALTGYGYLNARERRLPEGQGGREPAMMKNVAWLGLVAIGVSFALHPAAAALYPTYDYWRFSPSFFLLRLGLVMLLTAALFLYERRRGPATRSVVTLFGKESLIVYATHLTLIYGKFGTFDFSEQFGGKFGYLQAAVTTIVLMLLMYALALVWNHTKHGPPRLKLSVQLSVLAVLTVVFFFGPAQ